MITDENIIDESSATNCLTNGLCIKIKDNNQEKYIKVDFSGNEVVCSQAIIDTGILSLNSCKIKGYDKVYSYYNGRACEGIICN
jgi:hypothetical protein